MNAEDIDNFHHMYSYGHNMNPFFTPHLEVAIPELIHIKNQEEEYTDINDLESIKQKIIDNLKTIFDPEIPINIYDIGLIYNVEVFENNYSKILMTLTSPTCPSAGELPEMVKYATINVPNIKNCDVELTFDPPWDPSKMHDDAKMLLGID